MMPNTNPLRRSAQRHSFAIALIAVSGWLGGCSSQQMHATGQAWHRSLCNEQPVDMRSRCQADANRNYDMYRRDTTPAKPD
ncbi:hypothetical protein PCO31110_02722 [Pandoraea communis]|uniref:Uncharacterized protein n=1 Tax=Pandoraea communis TaxID=2508297 RepID=A0A5E4VK57_9BURK|nr:hypothetical protein C266_04284 [Pandoraea sp. SD6-2]VVE12263.1 hypothetical protein PCO31110_02722 [Pandoraea communis]